VKAPLCAALVGAGLALTGCALPADDLAQASAGSELSAVAGAAPAPADPTYAVPAPLPLTRPLLRPDLLVLGERALPRSVRRTVAAVSGVRAVTTLSLASVPVGGAMITVGAVDPASYRRFTPERTARMTEVWHRVAAGELAVTQQTGDLLGQPLGGPMVLGNSHRSVSLRVGAFASMAPRIDAVVNTLRGRQLGIPDDNAMLVSTGHAGPAEVAARIDRVIGRHVTVQTLAAGSATSGEQTAVLTGGSLGRAVGSFRYRYFADGTVAPDPTWVAANIRTEEVPILGRVTCHRVALPQLHGALQDIVDEGLTGSVDADDFGGCYAPRFIAHDPSQGLSLHTWGIAVDLNVAGNHRGTVGVIDRRVVAVFKRWGFAWGGDWQYTDPMHFELGALVGPG
jgi:hypothetical protein